MVEQEDPKLTMSHVHNQISLICGNKPEGNLKPARTTSTPRCGEEATLDSLGRAEIVAGICLQEGTQKKKYINQNQSREAQN